MFRRWPFSLTLKEFLKNSNPLQSYSHFSLLPSKPPQHSARTYAARYSRQRVLGGYYKRQIRYHAIPLELFHRCYESLIRFSSGIKYTCRLCCYSAEAEHFRYTFPLIIMSSIDKLIGGNPWLMKLMTYNYMLLSFFYSGDPSKWSVS